jgi:GH18 family chitinase
MVQYGFDGVDLDWEYPGAPDRGGQAVDVKNYPLLLQMIQLKFRIEQKSWGITITVPTSYWYLRWFDLKEIAKYVTYLNLMSYDLHGIWDSTDPIGPYVYGHTNLTEIDLALQLFWRNNISPSIINLGLAFYGRTFELSDPSCTTPGCGFKGPGPKGPCTDTPGILSYREIQDILTKNGSYQQFYDADASVNYVVYDEIGCEFDPTRLTKFSLTQSRGLIR